ncbi:MAG: hypothetical protein FVQ80_16610 [Planctomycetes bacterium]|nr:hypothetical protein [Planctomycetota bacterium]
MNAVRRAGPKIFLPGQVIETDLGYIPQEDGNVLFVTDQNVLDIRQDFKLAQGAQHDVPVFQAYRAGREIYILALQRPPGSW